MNQKPPAPSLSSSWPLLLVSGCQQSLFQIAFIYLISFGFSWPFWAKKALFQWSLALGLDLPPYHSYRPNWRNYKFYHKSLVSMVKKGEQVLGYSLAPTWALMWPFPPIIHMLAVQHALNQCLEYAMTSQTINPKD